MKEANNKRVVILVEKDQRKISVTQHTSIDEAIRIMQEKFDRICADSDPIDAQIFDDGLQAYANTSSSDHSWQIIPDCSVNEKYDIYYFAIDRDTCKATATSAEKADYWLLDFCERNAKFVAESVALKEKREKTGIFDLSGEETSEQESPLLGILPNIVRHSQERTERKKCCGLCEDHVRAWKTRTWICDNKRSDNYRLVTRYDDCCEKFRENVEC